MGNCRDMLTFANLCATCLCKRACVLCKGIRECTLAEHTCHKTVGSTYCIYKFKKWI